MKNKIIFFFCAVLLLVLSACNTTTTNTTTNVSTQGTTNTSSTTGSTTHTTTTSATTTTTTSTSTTTTNELPNDCIDKEGLILTFCDSFNGNSVDLTKWGFQLGTGSQYGLDGWGNNEEQYYRKENARVENGKLIIDAKKEEFGGKSYTSSRLYTDPTFTQTYGRFEASMKLPAGQGFWPAFWMMPKDSVYGGWAASGEIDIMEAKGRLTNEVGGTIHYGSQWPNNRYTGKTYYFPTGQNITQFHEYAVEWEPGEIRWYVDGKLFQTLTNWYSEDHPFPAPFDQDFYIILNLAIGGNYDGGRMPSDSMFPTTMEVEYVRAYQFDYSHDEESPSKVSNFNLISSLPEKAIVNWSQATDNTGIREYEVYLNDVFVGNTLGNQYTFKNLLLNTDYKASVIAIDFGGNKSEKTDFTFQVSYPLITTKIEAENYFEMSGIQVENTTDTGFGQNVGYINTNDYLVYKINVPTSGTYTITYRVASESNGGDLSLFVDNVNVNQTTFGATGGWQKWTSVTSTSFQLEAGIHTIKLVANKDGFNINYFQFQ